MMKLVVAVAWLLVDQCNGQVPLECFDQSVAAYGSDLGNDFSSQQELLMIDFDRTMKLNAITGCFGQRGEVYSL